MKLQSVHQILVITAFVFKFHRYKLVVIIILLLVEVESEIKSSYIEDKKEGEPFSNKTVIRYRYTHYGDCLYHYSKYLILHHFLVD